MKELKGKSFLIKDLINGSNFFRVPEYQRSFSWEEENFEALIQDILDADQSSEYFLGTIVLHKKEKDGIYDIVDGQQRLTTLLILFACLRDLIIENDFKNDIQNKIEQKENKVDGIPQKVRIEVRDREIFNELVVEIGGTLKRKDKKRLPEPQWRYVEAIETFHTKLDKLTQTRLENLMQFISQNCMMIFLSTTTFDDAFKLFTIVNDRGKQLRRTDVLKAKNIAPDIIISESVRNSLAQTWEQWEKNLGEDTFESVLYLIRFILLEEKPYNDLLFEYEEKIFNKGKLEKGEKFIATVFEYCKLYSDLIEDFSHFDSHGNRIRITGLLHIMKSEFKSYEWKACLMQYVKKYADEGLEGFISKLEIKYLEGVILGLNKDMRTSIFGKVMNAINKAEKASDVVKADVLKVNTTKMKKVLEEDMYGRTFTKYILLRLELLSTEHEVEKKFDAKSVEHVLPQTIVKGSMWAKWFPKDTQASWVNKLANLVLLSKGKNSSASNLEFDEKKKKYLSNRVTDYPRSVEILEYTEWKPKQLKARQKQILKTVLDDIF